MNKPSCQYCSDDANGYDDDDQPTCGNEATCTEVVRTLPRVIEVSDEEDNEDTCSACGGELTYMGALGFKRWYRCRNCGVDQSKEVRS